MKTRTMLRTMFFAPLIAACAFAAAGPSITGQSGTQHPPKRGYCGPGPRRARRCSGPLPSASDSAALR